jgi:ribosomal 50S subunit-recycling heat shock protein
MTAALIAASASMAGEIYKWTDEQGNVHYEDRLPTDGEDVERIDILSRNTDNAAVQARVEAAQEARAAKAKAAETEAEAATAEDPDADPGKRAEKCQMYRDRLESFLRSQRLYTQDANGERKYLDENETMAARQKAQEQVEKYCGS